MNINQYQRPHSERLHAAIAESVNFQPKPPGWVPPTNQKAIVDPDKPLDHLDDIQYQVLFNGLLEDWDNPVFTELGFCRAHAISLEQLIAMAERPYFQECLANIRKVRAMRRADIEAAAANSILERLLYITKCNLDSASAMKECRMAIKQITAILPPPPTPSPNHTRQEAAAPASNNTPPQEPPLPQPTSPQSTPNACEGTVPPNTTNADGEIRTPPPTPTISITDTPPPKSS